MLCLHLLIWVQDTRAGLSAEKLRLASQASSSGRRSRCSRAERTLQLGLKLLHREEYAGGNSPYHPQMLTGLVALNFTGMRQIQGRRTLDKVH